MSKYLFIFIIFTQYFTNVAATAANNYNSNNHESLFSNYKNTVKNLMKDAANSDDVNVQIGALKEINKILSNDNTFIDEFIENDLFSVLDEFLLEDNFELQFQSLNMLSLFTHDLPDDFQNGIITSIATLFKSSNKKISMLALDVASKIFSSETKMCGLCVDFVYAKNLFKHIITKDAAEIKEMKQIGEILGNTCKMEEKLDDKTNTEYFAVLSKFIYHDNTDIVAYGLDGMIKFLKHKNNIAIVMKKGMLKKIINFLEHDNENIQYKAVRSLIEFSTGTDEEMQYMLDLGILKLMLKLLQTKDNDNLIAQSLYLLSNVAAGSKAQIQALADENFIPLIVDFLHHSNVEIQKQAIWTISNMADVATPEIIISMVEKNVLKFLDKLLAINDDEILERTLYAANSLLKNSGKHFQAIHKMTENSDILEKIDELEIHENREIQNLAKNFSENFAKKTLLAFNNCKLVLTDSQPAYLEYLEH